MQDKLAEADIQVIVESDLIELHAPPVELSEIALREEMMNISICTYNFQH